MAVNYDNSAWFYDQLASAIFGKAIYRAQTYLLQFVQPGARILIVGGGTGWILEELALVQPSGLEITYVEVSAKMMALSKRRKTGSNKITFITEAVQNVDLPGEFDIVFTAFLFDSFSDNGMKELFQSLDHLLKTDGLWLCSDFQLTGKWWQSLLLKTMLKFFKLVCEIESSKLPTVEQQFADNHYQTVASQTFYGDFIVSKVYEKQQ